MSKQPPPTPTASAVGPCPTLLQISRTPRHWKLTQHQRTTPSDGRHLGICSIQRCSFPYWFGLVVFLVLRLFERGRQRKVRIDESKNVQATPTRTYCKCSRPLPYCSPNCRTSRQWKFTQHHCTTRPSHFPI